MSFSSSNKSSPKAYKHNLPSTLIMQGSPSDRPVKGAELGYRMEWQVPVCALIILVSVASSVLLLIKAKRRDVQPLRNSCLWVPCWRGLNPIWLLRYRALALFSLALMLYEIVAPSGFYRPFYFYTVWTFALVTLYFAIATVVSAQGCWGGPGKSDAAVDIEEQNKLIKKDAAENRSTTRVKEKCYEENIGCLGSLLHTVYQASSGAAILTDLVFWCLIVPLLAGKTFKLTLFIASMHILNLVFLLVDSALNNIPFHWLGITYFILWSFTYVAFQWTLHAFFGFTEWPYPFLDLATPWAPLWYLGVVVFHIPCYGVYVLLIKAKTKLIPLLHPHT